jgi:Putative beta barrel porin-7 (BBP7)
MMGPGDGMGCPPGMEGGGGRGHGCNGLLGDVLGICLPYADGGCAAPRWYDFEVGLMVLKRENTGRNVDFASDGIGGPIVLSSDDLDFGESTSFKFSAMMQCGPGSNLEFTYFGLFGWSEQAAVTSAGNNLFSPYSQFGLNPAGGFVETDAAALAGISYYSTFDNYEINFRQRWQSPNCRYQGSWLYGVRYFQLDEDFNYRIETDTGAPVGVDTVVGTNVNTNNAMTGLQIGGDMWICLIPGLRIGGEGKFAVLGNHANIDSRIAVSDAGGTTRFNESLTVGDVAFLGDLAAYATYRINYNWTLKGGYQMLYLDGASLAAENFNATPPAFFTQVAVPPGAVPARVATARENGDVFWHGFTVSVEYLW